MNINRREFLGRSLALGAAAALPLEAGCAENNAPIRRATDVIELGPAKIKVSRMGVGGTPLMPTAPMTPSRLPSRKSRAKR